MAARVVLYPSQLQAVLAGPAGPVARMLARKAIAVESQAKVNASGRPGPNVQTGRLRSSIHWRLAQDSRYGIVAQVIANTEYAAYVELGTDRSPPYPYLRPALRAAR